LVITDIINDIINEIDTLISIDFNGQSNKLKFIAADLKEKKLFFAQISVSLKRKKLKKAKNF
jgi:hypothetical protein